VACHVWPADKLPGPRLGGPVQPRKWPAACTVRSCDDAVARSPVARWWQGAAGELTAAIGRAPGKVVKGRAHPNGGAAWRR
jgi:hypothetical protein